MCISLRDSKNDIFERDGVHLNNVSEVIMRFDEVNYVWVTVDEYGDLCTEFIWPEEE